MQENNEALKPKNLCDLVIKGMTEKKAIDIRVLDLRKVTNAVADFFVICSANSDSQTDAISDSVELEIFKATQSNPWKKEGKVNKEWVLIDYVDVVAHIFKKDKREFFCLEELWGDAIITEVA
ncbi:MAG: ribosome-associated protein [Cyclobacteriaceae bacterium]|jgi:ribosome-associated protein